VAEPFPTPSFRELPAPPGGASLAVRGGRRLRLRRRLAGAGAALASAALVAGTLAAVGSGTNGASDELVPADPPPVVPSTSAGPPRVGATTAPRGKAPLLPSALPLAPGGSAEAPARVTEPDPKPERPATDPPPDVVYRTPDVVRRYTPAPPEPAPGPSRGPAPRVCGGSSDGTGSGELNTGYGFCPLAYAPATEQGHDLVLEICRDSTGPGSLHFSRLHEVELVVRDAQNPERVVWRWSTGHADASRPHVLETETSACWTWTVAWTDVDARGRQLEAGRYELAATTTARELGGHPTQVVAFAVR
jgi:hypothetical protein